MDTFDIVFDKPNFCSGQPVTGKVIVQNSKAIKARYLWISIYGAAETKWTETEPSMTYHHGKAQVHPENVHYESEIKFVSNSKHLWVPENDESKLAPGKHAFPFSFALPSQCAPSFEGHYGHIRYRVNAKLDRPWHFDSKALRPVTVFPTPIDYKISPKTKEDSKNIGTVFKKGNVTMKVTIPKYAYSFGENIPITIDIDNTSTRAATSVSAKLNQIVLFRAKKLVRNGSECLKSTNHSKGKAKKDIRVDGGTKSREQLDLEVPVVTPTFETSIIDVYHKLSVKVKTDTSLNNTLLCEISVFIKPPTPP